MSKPAFEEKAAPKKGAIREFVSYYKPDLRMFLLDMCCATVISLVDILFPVFTRKVLYDYTAVELLVPIFEKGELVYKEPHIDEIKATCTEEVDKLWGELLRFENPQTYYVDLSKPLWNLKHDLLNKYGADNL